MAKYRVKHPKIADELGDEWEFIVNFVGRMLKTAPSARPSSERLIRVLEERESRETAGTSVSLKRAQSDDDGDDASEATLRDPTSTPKPPPPQYPPPPSLPPPKEEATNVQESSRKRQRVASPHEHPDRADPRDNDYGSSQESHGHSSWSMDDAYSYPGGHHHYDEYQGEKECQLNKPENPLI